jgi:hypothetical protein
MRGNHINENCLMKIFELLAENFVLSELKVEMPIGFWKETKVPSFSTYGL